MSASKFLDRDWTKRFARKNPDGTLMGLFSSKVYNQEYLPIDEVLAGLEPFYLIARAKVATMGKVNALLEDIKKCARPSALPDDWKDPQIFAKIIRTDNIGDLLLSFTADRLLYGEVILVMSEAGYVLAPGPSKKTTYGV